MATVTIYSKENCPYCVHAKQLLDSKNVKYNEIRIDLDETKRDEMLQLSGGRRTVPQIFINDQAIGGFDDLAALAKSGELDKLLA
jgi:glutaredoxin 3